MSFIIPSKEFHLALPDQRVFQYSGQSFQPQHKQFMSILFSSSLMWKELCVLIIKNIKHIHYQLNFVRLSKTLLK